MTAQPITSIQSPLVPAPITTGRAAGHTSDKVLYNPMSGVFHCSTCDYMAESFLSVASHRRAHGTRKPKVVKGASIEDRIAQAVALLVEVREEVSAGVTAKPADNAWKTRAMSAEKSLKSLRRILGGSETAA